MKQLIFVILILNFNGYQFKEIKRSFNRKQVTNKFWARTCNILDCQDAIINCLGDECDGKKECSSCVILNTPRCSSCINEIFDDTELINGKLVCDDSDDLQILGCKIYCRGNNFKNNQGDCIIEDGLPVCKCTSALPT